MSTTIEVVVEQGHARQLAADIYALAGDLGVDALVYLGYSQTQGKESVSVTIEGPAKETLQLRQLIVGHAALT